MKKHEIVWTNIHYDNYNGQVKANALTTCPKGEKNKLYGLKNFGIQGETYYCSKCISYTKDFDVDYYKSVCLNKELHEARNKLNLLNKAFSFAKEKHKGQLDDEEKSYFKAHLLNTFNILKEVSNDINLLCAGILHDTLEDTETTYKELKKEFNKNIADLVNEVTHKRILDKKGNNKITLFPNLKTQRGIMIKFADRLSNLSRIDCWDKERQQHYLKKSKFWYNTVGEKKKYKKF